VLAISGMVITGVFFVVLAGDRISGPVGQGEYMIGMLHCFC
jgi:hypothetical protein